MNGENLAIITRHLGRYASQLILKQRFEIYCRAETWCALQLDSGNKYKAARCKSTGTVVGLQYSMWWVIKHYVALMHICQKVRTWGVDPASLASFANKEKGGTYHVTRLHYPREFRQQSPAVLVEKNQGC